MSEYKILADCVAIYKENEEIKALFIDDENNIYYLDILDESHFEIGISEYIENLESIDKLSKEKRYKIIRYLEG